MNNSIANTLLTKACKAVTTERGTTHGDTNQSFEMIAELWSVYLSHRFPNGDVKLTPVDVAQMMSLLKKSRSVYGDTSNEDHFIDDLGYSSLAGMFQLAYKVMK